MDRNAAGICAEPVPVPISGRVAKRWLSIVLCGAFLLVADPGVGSAFHQTETAQELCYSGKGELTLDLAAVPCQNIVPGSFQGTYGQDGHYTQGAKPFYKDNSNGTLTDQNTGLTWQQDTGCVVRNWQASKTYCENLELAGKDDWRLPSRHELTTILDPSRWRPVLNTEFFDNCFPDGGSFFYYWSSTSHPEKDSMAYLVEFGHGGPLGCAGAESFKTEKAYARCVRGDVPPVVSQFVDNQDGTVSDQATGLMWQKGSQPILTQWDENLTYCENLELAGYTDWRLPNIRELESLVDDSRYDPAIDPIFEYTSEKPSSTTIPINPERVLLPSLFSLSFVNGSIIDSSKRNILSARCVRLGPESPFWSKKSVEGVQNLNGLDFINSKIGWAVGSGEQVAQTTDGGRTWTKLHGNGSFTYEKVDFVDADHGWVICNLYGLYGRGRLFHSGDGGRTWSEQWRDATGYHRDLHFIDRSTGWVIGSNAIHKTQDGGLTWVDQTTPIAGNYGDVFFLDQNTGWIAGSAIIKTQDGGATWIKQHDCPEGALQSIFFIDGAQGWAVGSQGRILATADGGDTWQPVSSGTDAWLYLVGFSDRLNGFVFGQFGVFLHTTDGGQTWARQYGGPPPLSAKSLNIIQGRTGYALVGGDSILKLKPGILPLARGDLNADGDIDLLDLVSGLQAVCHLEAAVRSAADADSDQRIGLEDALYILQRMADIR